MIILKAISLMAVGFVFGGPIGAIAAGLLAIVVAVRDRSGPLQP